MESHGFLRRPRLVEPTRRVCYGYRENEFNSIPPFIKGKFIKGNEVIEMDPTLEIVKYREPKDVGRPVVMADLGCAVVGAAFPHPDPNSTATTLAGAMFRFCRKIPNSGKKKPEFRKFVKDWLNENLQPLAPDTDTSFETWIQNAPYSQARKNELKTKWAEVTQNLRDLEAKHFIVKSFVKDECYPEPKHSRAINSRTDVFKCAVGPIFKLISDKLFALPWFIKKIPIDQRPEYIIDMLYQVGTEYVTSDYTSFEAHFDPNMMQDCEMQLVEHMVQFLPDGKDFLTILRRAKFLFPNCIFFKNVSLKIHGKRMSGEMDTSTSNGFSNLMFMLYLCKKNGNLCIRGVIEGDDGLFVMLGDPPKTEVFEKFGLSIKLINFRDINHASFCGMVFDLTDRTNVTNPIDVLLSFGWTTSNYARSNPRIHKHLIRAKALSLAYQYPACPILSTLAHKMCELTAGIDVLSFLNGKGARSFDQYKMEQMKNAAYMDKNNLNRKPGHNTRLLVETLYGISIADQITIEGKISQMTEIKPIDIPEILSYCTPVTVDYYSRYCCKVDVKTNYFMPMSWPAVRKQFRYK